MPNFDVVIIGGGIVGLATAMQLKEMCPHIKVALLEKESKPAQHQTGNNSGVIHSGLYYKPGSLKAKNCIEGYQLLLDFCQREEIPYELCGKLVIATHEEELERLENLYQRGLQNGLEKISKINSSQIKHYEPYATGIAALWVPYTGIVDYKMVAAHYADIFTKRMGGEIFLNTQANAIRQNGLEVEIICSNNKTFTTKLLVNTAGLYCDKLATMDKLKPNIRIIPFRGEYYVINPMQQHLVKNLIYPVPNPAFPFLGVHFTRRIDGSVEAGPNAVFAFRREGYKKSSIHFGELSESLMWNGFRKVMLKYWNVGLGEYWRSYNKTAFTHALQRLLPIVKKSDLSRGGAGVRAQACDRQGNLIDDFLIIENQHGFHVLNAPSPAATSSLAIGRHIAELTSKKLAN
jgi:(S)-2-hydroxyglutarate dehydrogenase